MERAIAAGELGGDVDATGFAAMIDASMAGISLGCFEILSQISDLFVQGARGLGWPRVDGTVSGMAPSGGQQNDVLAKLSVRQIDLVVEEHLKRWPSRTDGAATMEVGPTPCPGASTHTIRSRRTPGTNSQRSWPLRRSTRSRLLAVLVVRGSNI